MADRSYNPLRDPHTNLIEGVKTTHPYVVALDGCVVVHYAIDASERQILPDRILLPSPTRGHRANSGSSRYCKARRNNRTYSHALITRSKLELNFGPAKSLVQRSIKDPQVVHSANGTTNSRYILNISIITSWSSFE